MSNGFINGNIISLTGCPGSLASDLSFQFTYAVEPQYSPDVLCATEGQDLFTSQDSSVRAVFYKHPELDYRVIISGFVFGALMDDNVPNEKSVLMSRYLHFLIKDVSRIPEPIENDVPESCILFPNYPNPFNTSTTLTFENLNQAEFVDIRIYNSIGQQVRNLFSGMAEAGLHQIVWNGTNDNRVEVESGIYLCVIKSVTRQRAIKLVLMK